MRSMRSAPRDQVILVLGPHGWRRAYYLDCEWLRQPFEWDHRMRHYRLPGDPTVSDCWRVDDGSGTDIELDEARGWKPAAGKAD